MKAAVFLAFFHLVGVAGLTWPESRAFFQQLTPLNLLLSLGLLAWFHRPRQYGKILPFAALIFLSGYLVEVVGVHTGRIFGVYSYGQTLGPRLWDVPPMMGVNWLILIYCTGLISMRIDVAPWLQAIAGAALMVLLDLLIEPVAIQLDFWQWAGGEIPWQNYLAWFVIAWLMLWGFHRLRLPVYNYLALPLYLIQLGFFAILGLLL